MYNLGVNQIADQATTDSSGKRQIFQFSSNLDKLLFSNKCNHDNAQAIECHNTDASRKRYDPHSSDSTLADTQ